MTSSGAAAAQSCVQPAAPGHSGVIHGTVTGPTDEPVARAVVVAQWRTWNYLGTSLTDSVTQVTALSAADGRYRLCALPTLASLSVSATHGQRSSEQMIVSLPDSVARAVDLHVTYGGWVTRRIGAASGPGTEGITGIVEDSAGAPIIGAHVALSGNRFSTLSNSDGGFDLLGLPEGEHVIVVRRIGYEPISTPVTLGGGEPLRLAFMLDPVPVQLSPVVTTAFSAFELTTGFSERRRRGPGVFFDRRDLDRRNPQHLTDVFRTIPGFRIQPALTPWGYQNTATLDRANTGANVCNLDYYVNGHEYTPTSMGIDNDLPPAQIEALEVYKPSETPAQFLGKRSRCGVVVIWTRYRAHEIER